MVTIVHVLVVGLLIVVGANSCIHRKVQPEVMPVEFIVAVDDGPEMTEPVKPVDAVPEVKPPPPPPPAPIPDPPPADVVPEEVKKIETKPKPPETKPKPPVVKPPEPKPEIKPKPPEAKPKPPDTKPTTPVRKPIELGRRVVTAPNKNPPPPGIRLSPEEIQRRLALGATPGNRNLMPEGDSLDYEVIRRQLYKAWAQPGSVPNQVTAEVEIRMNAAGTIISRRMLRASGNAVMDRSVMDAVQSVFRIDGLTPGFIDRKSGRVTIIFELTTGAG